MRRRKLLSAACCLALVACGQASTETTPEETTQTAQTTVTLPKMEGYEMIHPKMEDVTYARLDKLTVYDIFLVDDKGVDTCSLYVDYHFRAVSSSEKPNSFSDMYQDSVYVNGVAVKRIYGDIENVEAQINTKVLPMHYAQVGSGFTVLRSDVEENKEFTLLVYWDELKCYEFVGHLGDLYRIK